MLTFVVPALSHIHLFIHSLSLLANRFTAGGWSRCTAKRGWQHQWRQRGAEAEVHQAEVVMHKAEIAT